MQPIVCAENIAKAYGRQVLFQAVSLAVPPGACVALIGHNGCGKTTLLRMLAGLVTPTAGKITYAAHGAHSKRVSPGMNSRESLAVRPSMGYIPEHFPKSNLGARDYLACMGRIEGLSGKPLETAMDALFADFFMTAMQKTPMKHLSKGSLQKMGAMQALLCPHDILFLDEPLNGQDAASQRVFIDKILARKRDGCAVVLSCHEPYLTNRLADEIYEIKGGALVPVSQMDARLTEYAAMRFAQGAQAVPALPAGAAITREDGGALRIEAPLDAAEAALRAMLDAGFTLMSYHRQEG